MNINQLIEQFEAQSIGGGDFNHRNHLRVAWHYINHYSVSSARERVHQGLIKLTKVLGAEEKYHRTMTDFFIDYLLQVKWYLNTDSWEQVEERCGYLLNDAKSLIGIYYSESLLGSDHARKEYTEPDRLVLDRATLMLQPEDYPVFDVQLHDSPIIVSMPHHGQFIPHDIVKQMTAAANDSADTDWYLTDLYEFLDEVGVTRINANYSRYTIDLNRDKSGEVLYAGADNTELCPTSNFDREPLYAEDNLPDSEEISRRVAHYWQPYHDQLQKLIARAKEQFGYCLLFEAHTIQSHVPRFSRGVYRTLISALITVQQSVRKLLHYWKNLIPESLVKSLMVVSRVAILLDIMLIRRVRFIVCNWNCHRLLILMSNYDCSIKQKLNRSKSLSRICSKS